MTLSLGTAYRSFGGEMEASSTPMICRLLDSCRHQLSALALSEHVRLVPTTDIRLSTSAQIWIGWLGRSIQLAQGRSIAAAVWRTIRLPLSRIEVNDAGRADKF